MSALSGTSLGGYGHPIFKRDGYRCVFCGFDGNGFNQWRQLTIHRIRSKKEGGQRSADNLVTACQFCVSVASRMKFSTDLSRDEVLRLKQERVTKRLKDFRRFWTDEVALKDTALTSEQGGPYLPNPLLLDVSSLELSDWQLAMISSDNDDLRLELTAKGELVIMPLAGAVAGRQEAELLYQVAAWAQADGTGVIFGPDTGFHLPNGAVYAPDLSWLLRERWYAWLRDNETQRVRPEPGEDPEADDAEAGEVFASFCPDFVLELRSTRDTLASVQRKLEEYLENGARLGWLIDPIRKRVHIYRPGMPAQVLEDPATVSGETVLPGFELNLREIW